MKNSKNEEKCCSRCFSKSGSQGTLWHVKIFLFGVFYKPNAYAWIYLLIAHKSSTLSSGVVTLQWGSKNYAPKSAFLGIFWPFMVKYWPFTLSRAAECFDFPKLQYNMMPLQKTSLKSDKNSKKNNFFRVVKQKCASELRTCHNQKRKVTNFMKESLRKYYMLARMSCVLSFTPPSMEILTSLWKK